MAELLGNLAKERDFCQVSSGLADHHRPLEFFALFGDPKRENHKRCGIYLLREEPAY